MKHTIEITHYISGKNAEGDWVRVRGLTAEGRSTVTHEAKGEKASALRAKLDNLVPPGEDIASRRLLVEFVGNYGNGRQRFKDGKPETKADGSPVYSRVMNIEGFTILDGLTLELARHRRDATLMRGKAEALAAEGKFEEAYRILDDLAGRVCNKPPRAAVAKDDLSEDEEFGETEAHRTGSSPALAEGTSKTTLAAGGERQPTETATSDAPAALDDSPVTLPVDVPVAKPVPEAFDPETSAAQAFAQEDARLAAEARRQERRDSQASPRASSASPSASGPARDVLDDEAPSRKPAQPSSAHQPTAASPSSPAAPTRPTAPPPVHRAPEHEGSHAVDAASAARPRARGFGLRPAGFRP